jgi:DNA-binding GntR family transcriptional regulator
MTDDPRRYVQIAATLRREMLDGQLKPGSMVTITRICQETGHSRQTCGKAMGILADEGLIKRIPGLGYYVV